MKKWTGWVLFVCVLWASIAILKAQTTTGTISGVVRDAQQAVVPGAAVSVQSTETGTTRQAVTDSSGRYRFPQLSPGQYQVQAEMNGFQTEIQKDLTLNVGSDLTIDFTLKVGDVTEKVEVTAEAPLVQTAESTLSSLVNEKALQDLPLNGRSFIELARLQEGVNPVRSAAGGAAASFGQNLSVSGSNPESNNFMMDGTNVSTYQSLGPGGVGGTMPGVESVKEFRVLTQNFSAEFGRGTGAVINSVSKSGTNSFHGSLYEFVRNDALDATPWKPAVKSPFTRNQFGFSLGGPILKNRFFFFGNYEGLRERLGQTSSDHVLTPDARAGRVQNPTTLAFSQVNVSPGVVPLLNLYPMPTPGGQDFHDGSAEYLDTYEIPTDKTYVTSRLDYILSQKHSLFARYTYDTGHTIEINDFSNFNYQLDKTPLRYGTLELNSVLSPTLLNTFRFGATKTPTISDNAPVEVDKSLYLSSLRMPTVSTTGLQAIGPNDALLHIRDYKSFEYADTVSIAKGSHSLKIGFNGQRIINNPTIQTRMGGRFSVSSITNLLQGFASSVEFAPPELSSPSRSFRQNMFAFFFQDDYSMRSNLTLNLGLRYEFTTTLSEINGLFPRLDDAKMLTGARTDIIVGKPGYLTNPDLKDFEPRVGIAWDPFGQGKTSIRSGFGVYHDHILFSIMSHEYARMYPHNVFTVQFPANTVSFPNTAAAIVAAVPPPAIGNTAIWIENHPAPTYSIHYNLDIQQQLGKSMVVGAGYRGSRGVHVLGYEDTNLALPVNFLNKQPDQPWLFNTSSIGGVVGPVRANPNFDAYTYKFTGNDSFYNAFSVKLEKRFTSGLQFQSHYTFSKSIDDVSTSKGGGNDGPGGIGVVARMSWYDKLADRAVSPFDLTHSFTFNSSYQLPFGKGSHGLVANALGGWLVSGIWTWSSGPPMTVTEGTSTNAQRGNTAILGGSRRPDQLVGRTKDDIISGKSTGCAAFPTYAGRSLGDSNLYFDPCAYSFVDTANFGGTNYLYWGNLGRNTLRAPGFFNVDFSLAKDWKISKVSENFAIQFRGELYNIFNHPNLGIPSASIANGSGTPSTAAGQINSTVNPSRQVQFGIKAVF